ncbi:unnamed protein product [Vitrella brassicaformis CCMP3155]|uniref:Uncharacterized protein n=1 Tax=Vitrella brassicaformis (strain CCMP3155) TaxID=1169540 RepID=A0A0G4G9E4_VITBC|nr:unnamed protein product [Vitrella brassicaformis CCMP3155]|eukprot:CEM25454.1 unnamed protein product [Vitrella brassicaformis CCMP3155]
MMNLLAPMLKMLCGAPGVAAMDSRISCRVTLALLAVMVPWLTAHSPSTGRSNTLVGGDRCRGILGEGVNASHGMLAPAPHSFAPLSALCLLWHGGTVGSVSPLTCCAAFRGPPRRVPADAKVGALCREVKALPRYPAGYINPGNVLLQNQSISVADTVAEAFKNVGDCGRNPIRFFIKRAPRPVRWALLFPIGLPVPIYD